MNSSPGRTPPVQLAAFDFDGTLTDRDSVVPFIRRILQRRRLALAARAVPSLPAAAISLARRNRDEFRSVATRVVFAGMPYEDVTAAARRYGEEVLPSRLRAATIDELQRHRSEGATTLIVSASYREYLEPVAALLGVDDVLATELEVVDGVCTGGLVGGNCRGPAKVKRLERWLADHGLDRRQVEVTAYGDSSGDREMLAWADRPVWVPGTRR